MNIIICPNCNNPLFVLKTEITHNCPNCDFAVDVKEAVKNHTGE